MVNIRKRKLLYVIMICAIMLLCMMCSSFSQFVTNAYAETTNTLDEESIYELCKEFTNTETLYQDDANKIDDYENYLNTQFEISNKNNMNQEIYDEWIFKIVPEILFINEVQDFLYIGDKYGFYIDYNVELDYYLVYIMSHIFVDYDNGTMSSKIEPLYYEKYYYDSDIGKVQLQYVTEKVFGVDYTNTFYYYQKYSSVKNVYLKDISFTGTLYNENHLNSGEFGYKADQDNGAFFVGNHYRFNGVSTQSGKMDFLVDTLSMGIGYIDTPFFKGLGYALDIASFIENTVNFAHDVKRDFRNELTNENDYGFNMGAIVPKQGDNLLKSSGAHMQTNNTNEAILIGINDNYVSNTYYYNYSDRFDKWNSKLVSQISMDIVEEDENFIGSTVNNIATDVKTKVDYVYTLNNSYSTEIELYEVNKQVYILNDAKHKVKFTAPENGLYTISTYGNVKNLLKSTKGEIYDVDANNKKLIVDLNKGEVFFCDVTKHNFEGSDFIGIAVEFTPQEIIKGETQTITIAPGEKEYFTYDSKAIGFDYYFNSTDIIEVGAAQTTYYNTFYRHSGNGIHGSVVKNTGKYYISIKNNSSISQIVELTVNGIEELNIDNVNEVNIIYQKAIVIEIPYTMDVSLTAEFENVKYIDVLNNNGEIIAQ